MVSPSSSSFINIVLVARCGLGIQFRPVNPSRPLAVLHQRVPIPGPFPRKPQNPVHEAFVHGGYMGVLASVLAELRQVLEHADHPRHIESGLGFGEH